MRKATLFTTLVVITSCSTGPMPSKKFQEEANFERNPSSLMSGKYFNDLFKNAADSYAIEKQIDNDLDKFKELNEKGEFYLSEFDHELDESIKNNSQFKFDESESYKKLMVVRSLREKMHDKITFYYLKFSQGDNNNTLSNNDPSKKSTFEKAFKRLKERLNSKDEIDQVVFSDVKTKINLSLDEVNTFHSNDAHNEHKLSNKFKDFTKSLFGYKKWKEDLITRYKKTELDYEIEDYAKNIEFKANEGRGPQSTKTLKYFPSASGAGNIMGLQFPKNTWALTYDDGPNPIHTQKIIENLDSLGHKATFFWLAQNVIQYKSMSELAKNKGMARANHSWSHAQLTKLSDAGLDKEITQSTKVESEIYGEPVRFFRCPYGAGNGVAKIRQRIADLDMIHVFWNVDTLDWQDKNADSIFERAKKQMIANGRGVVLFHDIHPQSVIASKKLLEWSDTFKGSEKEIRWVTLPEIVDEQNK